MEECNSVKEIKRVLNIFKLIAALSKCEKLCVSVHRLVVKMRVRQWICSHEMMLLNLHEWGLNQGHQGNQLGLV